MNFTEQKIEEFEKEFNIFGECNPPNCSNIRWGGNFHKLKEFLIQTIKDAKKEMLDCLPEERKECSFFKDDKCFECSNEWNYCRQEYLNNLKDKEL